MALINEVEKELSQITDHKCALSVLPSGSILITLPVKSVFESRWIMQSFNTPRFRAQRRDRSLQEVEVKYR